MLSNRLALAALAAACIGAAGVGGYLATRHNVATIAAPEAAASTAIPQPVKETEALISAAAKPASETDQSRGNLNLNHVAERRARKQASIATEGAQTHRPTASASRQAAPRR